MWNILKIFSRSFASSIFFIHIFVFLPFDLPFYAKCHRGGKFITQLQDLWVSHKTSNITTDKYGFLFTFDLCWTSVRDRILWRKCLCMILWKKILNVSFQFLLHGWLSLISCRFSTGCPITHLYRKCKILLMKHLFLQIAIIHTHVWQL